MSKKSLRKQLAEDADWRENEERELKPDELGETSVTKSTTLAPGKPSRQRIEEYFELKRLAEALQEDLDDDVFKE